jgi:hypothetical protein
VSGLRVIVCGGRDYFDRDAAWAELDMLDHLRGISCIIQGGANGADYIAARWAETRKVYCEEYRPDWQAHGRAAGPKRNQLMLDSGHPDLVVAFRGGRGTADMMKRAKSAGIEVMEIK